MYQKINPKLVDFRGNREIILKARQMGFTTYIAARMFKDTICTPNTHSMMIAQDEVNAKRIFQIIKRYYDNLPPFLKPVATSDSTSELNWGSIGSSFFVGWAGSKKIGRGGTLNNVHASEAAFWENAGEIVAGLMQSVPEDGNIFIESTANGVGNYFQEEYNAAEEGDSVFSPRFFPWFTEPTYRAKFLANGKEFFITEEEEYLAELYGLDQEQLIWRRNKIMELRRAQSGGESELGTFVQEYPSNAHEAFISSGATFFDTKFIDAEIIPNLTTPLETSPPPQYKLLKRIQNEPHSKFEIFERPLTGHKYILSADTAEGLNHDGKADFCSADVIDFSTHEQVGHIRGKWEPHEYAGILAELGTWYNMGLIVVERNNHGHSVLNSLINHYSYPLQEKDCSGVYLHSEYDPTKKKQPPAKPGFPTNVKTKALAINSITELVFDAGLKINSRGTANELRNFCKLPGGRWGCIIGHDDCVMSLAVGCAVIIDANFIRRTTQKQKKTYGKIKGLGNGRGVNV